MDVIQERIKKAFSNLLKLQYVDGHFEGELSSNAFPTCVYALIQLELGLPVDDKLIGWFIRSQNDQGFWGLDACGNPNDEATLLAKLALKEIWQKSKNDNIESALRKIPDLKLNKWLVKLFYAHFSHISWNEINAPKILSTLMRFGEMLMPILPKSIIARFKPPDKYAPPVRLFYTPTFQNLFIAEKHTLVPVFIIMEIYNKNRPKVVSDLISWLLNARCSDGSWFRVGLITELSVLALIDAKKYGYGNNDIDRAIEEGARWLQSLRSIDGGCREAINLNVWDTSWSALLLSMINSEEYKAQIDNAVNWLINNQNDDGGWAFSGIPKGNLPSDADDTALAIWASLRSSIKKDNIAIKRGIEWLKKHQSKNGGWGTYRPGVGDVNCVSITSHVISAFIEHGGLDNEINKAIEWIKASIDDKGYWRDLWLSRNTYGTALAIEALIKTGNSECDEVKRGVKWLESFQNDDGGWGEDINGNRTASTIEQTAWSTYALLLYNPNNVSAKKGLDYILSHQNPDGSFNPSCVGIYWEVIGGYSDPVYPYVFALMALNSALTKI